jgi:hypothetical protein
MSDAAKSDTEKKVTAQLIVTLFDDGTCGVNYPSDELVARGMLGMAGAVIDDEFRARKMISAMQNAPRVVPANGRILPRRNQG